jgi:hypothetical protein
VFKTDHPFQSLTSCLILSPAVITTPSNDDESRVQVAAMPPPPIPRAQTASHLSAQSSAASGSTGFSSKLAGSVEQQTYLVELQQLGTHMCQRWKASEDVQGAWRAVTAQKDRLAEWTTLLTTVSLLGLFPSVMSFIIHHRAKGAPFQLSDTGCADASRNVPTRALK